MVESVLALACLTRAVSYGPPPDAGAPTSRVLITAGGGVAGVYATKTLWHVRGGRGTATVNGVRLDAPGHVPAAAARNWQLLPVDVATVGPLGFEPRTKGL